MDSNRSDLEQELKDREEEIRAIKAPHAEELRTANAKTETTEWELVHVKKALWVQGERFKEWTRVIGEDRLIHDLPPYERIVISLRECILRWLRFGGHMDDQYRRVVQPLIKRAHGI
jgi:hypothetical protein